MEEMLAYSGKGNPNDETTDIKEHASHGLAALLKNIGQSLAPVWNAVRKLSGDGLMGFMVYAFVFVGVFNSSTNCMQFAKLVLVAVQAKNFSEEPNYQINRDLVRFIAVAVLSVICLVQFFSPRAGRRFNNLAAVVKIMFMLLLIVFGGLAAIKATKNPGDWTEKNCFFSNGTWSVFPNESGCCFDSDIDYALTNTTCFSGDYIDNVTRPDADHMFTKEGTGSGAWVRALLLVLFSFQGWENATFVSLRLDYGEYQLGIYH